MGIIFQDQLDMRLNTSLRAVLIVALLLTGPIPANAADEPPGPPTNIVLTKAGPGAVKVTWNTPKDSGSGPILFQTATAFRKGLIDSKGRWWERASGDCRTEQTSGRASCTIRGLPNGTYNIRVLAVNRISNNTTILSDPLITVQPVPAVGVACVALGDITSSKGKYLECGSGKRWQSVTVSRSCITTGARAGLYICSQTATGRKWKRFVSTVQLPWAGCDPEDSRLTGITLPTAPREARVAAACIALEWIKNSSPTYNLELLSSANVAPEGLAIIRKSVQGGLRLFNRFALDPSADVIVIASGDHGYSCQTGLEVVEPLLVGASTWRGSWRDFPNSGCIPSTHVGGGYAATLGRDGSVRLGWFLATDEMVIEKPTSDGNGSGNYLWQMRGFAHELVHATQFQVNGRSVAGENHSDPGWYGEGQANYLGAAVTWLAFGNDRWRSAMVSDLRQWAPDDGTFIDLREVRDGGRQAAWEDQLMYVAGQFAAEFLIAHYGYDASWSWWRAWSGCLGSIACIDSKTSALFGISTNEFYRQLNTYVHDQVTGNVTVFRDAACDQSAFTNLPSGRSWRAAAAAACINERWLDTSDDPAASIEVLAPASISPRATAFIEQQGKVGLKLYGAYAKDPASKVTFIVPDSPTWLCSAGEEFFSGSEHASSWRTDPWSGCDPTLIGPHSWSRWSDADDCAVVNSFVNQPGTFTSGPRKGQRWLILSQCTGFLDGSQLGSDTWGLRKLLQSNTQTLGPGHMRYWFESGWEALFTSYGGAIKTNKSLTQERPWISEWNDSLITGGSLPSIATFDETGNGPSAGISVPLNGIMTTLAAEYVLSEWGSAATFALIDGWADSDENTEQVTMQVLGITESELFLSIDAYIKSELGID